ncbi:TIM barrel protein [Actinopolymorpha alba]|uniref:TIM barrel protein n=1 Tax=Actinopolymorpha alba TaxID=533267 RepID=UPI00037921BA|nr:TIM barrel protein [Actinopolymorpha alba]
MELGPLAGRIAGAPISWGVCEAPGWGYELPPSVVLAEMAQLGLAATELGPTGYLGSDPDAVRATLDPHGLTLVGGFLPVALHVAPEVDLSEAEAAIRTLAAAGSEVVVLAADAGPGGYDRKVQLDATEWSQLLRNLDRVRSLISDLGLRSTLHPHVGTAIESRASVLRLLQDSDVPLCLDTGHLAIGGTDPLEIVRNAAQRVGHVHLKDVRLDIAKQVADETVSFIDGVRSGLFAPLGQGDVDIAGVVTGLEEAGFTGWYVLEQDTALAGPPAPGEGPLVDVRRSVEYLRDTVVPALAS